MARLTIDMTSEFHRVIKGEAALRGISIRDFVLASLHEQIAKTHKPTKSHKHDCPLCSLYDGKTFKNSRGKAIEAPLGRSGDRHYIYEDELPHALKAK